MNSLFGWRRSTSHHGPNTPYKANTEHKPWVSSHQPLTPPVGMQRPGRDGDDSDAKACVHESVVEIRALERRHAAIISRFAVEDQINSNQGAAEDAGAVKQTLTGVALIETCIEGRVRGL